MKKRLLVWTAALLLVALAIPAAAITNGTADDDGEFPHVGQLLFFVPDFIDDRFPDPGGWFSCSGTLLDPGEVAGDVVLTAGHCAFAVGLDGKTTTDLNGDGAGGDSPAADPDGDGVANNGVGGNDVWVSFELTNDFESFLPPSSSFATNQARYDAWSAILDARPEWHRGVADAHPGYNDAAFFLFDVGVVSLTDDPSPVVGAALLPTDGYLDQFVGKKKARSRFTPVGYGLERGFPFFSGGDTRMFADVMIIDATGVFGIGAIAPGTAVVFSNNNGRALQGGTCFGDSGGPTFEKGTDTVVAVTSFGVNLTCTGTGGAYRIDKTFDLGWIRDH
jgi:hypothetical protein